MSIVYFSSGEGNSITDLSQDTGGNRLMRMMIMIMMMCCDWHCSHSFSVKKKQHVCRDAKHILNHNLFAGDPNLFWPVGLEFKQRKIQTEKRIDFKAVSDTFLHKSERCKRNISHCRCPCPTNQQHEPSSTSSSAGPGRKNRQVR